MHKATDCPDYYEVLDVSRKSNNMEIREAYVRMKQTYDSHNQALYSLCSDEEAQEMRSQIEMAYSVLQDEVKRKAYDDTRFSSDTTGQHAVAHPVRGVQDSFQSRTDLGYKSASTLHPVKAKQIHAPGGRDDTVQAKLAEIVSAGDPGDGALLRKLREASGVSDLQMHESTKIGIDLIRAIESNTFERLPKGIFVKGFLRSYLKYLLVPDIEVFVSAFVERLETSRMPQSDI